MDIGDTIRRKMASGYGAQYSTTRSFSTWLKSFRFRVRWGTSISAPMAARGRIWIQLRRYTDSVHQLLRNNPMIALGGDEKLHAVVPLDHVEHWTEEEPLRFRKDFFTPGLATVSILPLDRFRETGSLSLVPVARGEDLISLPAPRCRA